MTNWIMPSRYGQLIESVQLLQDLKGKLLFSLVELVEWGIYFALQVNYTIFWLNRGFRFYLDLKGLD